MVNASTTLGEANGRILVVHGDRDLGAAIKEFLTAEGFVVTSVTTPDEAIALMRQSYFSLVLTTYLFGALSQSERIAHELQAAAAQVPLGCLTAWSAIPPAVADRYAFILSLPIGAEPLLAAVARHAAVQAPDPEQSGTITRYFDALGRRDWDAVANLCAESVRYHLPGADPLSGTIEGRAAFRAYTSETFQAFPHASFEVTALGWLPHGVVASYRGLWSASEGSVQTSDGDVYFQFRGSQIAQIGVRTDLGRIREQMSLAT